MVRARNNQGTYERGDTPSRVTSTLEALGVLLALKLKHGEQPQEHRSRITVTPTMTDNRGNGAATNDFPVPSISHSHGDVDLHEENGNRSVSRVGGGDRLRPNRFRPNWPEQIRDLFRPMPL